MGASPSKWRWAIVCNTSANCTKLLRPAPRIDAQHKLNSTPSKNASTRTKQRLIACLPLWERYWPRANATRPASPNRTSLEQTAQSTIRPVEEAGLHGSFYDKAGQAISPSRGWVWRLASGSEPDRDFR